MTRYLSFLLISLLLSGCPDPRSIPSFEASPDVAELTREEKNLWAYQEELHEYLIAQNALVFDDLEALSYLNAIKDRVFPDYQEAIQVFIYNDIRANAFMLSNGNMYFTLGMLARLQNEAQLAMVVAHEGHHYTERHTTKDNMHFKSTRLVTLAASIATENPYVYILGESALASGYSVRLENEADELGFESFYQAGYEHKEGAEPFMLLAEESKALDYTETLFFRSHPKMSRRVKNLQTASQALNVCIEPCTQEGQFTKHLTPIRLRALETMHQAKLVDPLIFLLSDDGRRKRFPDVAHFYLGAAYFNRNEDDTDRALALEHLEVAKTKRPDFAPTFRALGEYWLNQDGHEVKAAEYYQQYLALEPNADDRAYIEFFLASVTSETAS